MQKRQVVLKIHTSGSSVLNGNRVVEIDCIELINGEPTNRNFHRYINPNRIIESAAFKEHGLSYQFLRTHPPFRNIAREFLDFILDAELLVHNAPTAISYINREFEILGWPSLDSYCDITSIDRPIHANACKCVRSQSQADLVLLTC